MEPGLECKECEKMIPDFIGQRMNYQMLKRFCGHIQECAECREELTIQFLVSEGISRLEEGDAFDLNRELSKRMAEARKKLRRNEHFLSIGAVFQLLSTAAVLCVVLWIIFA